MRSFEEISEDLRRAYDTNESDALLRCAEELDSIDTPQAEASARRARGWVHSLRGEYPEALDHYHCALALYEELGDRGGVATVTRNIGGVYRSTSDYPTALEHYLRALALYEELGDLSGVATVTGNIGIVHDLTGDYPAALEHHNRALAIHEELGDRSGIASAVINFGVVQQITGDYPSALEHFHRGMALFEQIGDRRSMAGATINFGVVYTITGEYPTALEYYHRAMALLEELGDRTGVATITGNIGNIHERIGNYPAALEHYHRALTLNEELANRSGVANTSGNIGGVHHSTGDYQTALEYLQRSLALYKELGERSGQARVTGNIVDIYLKIGSDADARTLMTTLDAMQIDDPLERIEREHHRATIQVLDGNLEDAARSLQKALTIAQEHGIRSDAADIHKALRELALKQSDFTSYVEHNNEYTRITEEINGKDTATKLAMQAKQREIDAERRETEKQLAVLHSTLPKHIADRVARGETVNDHYDNAAVIFLDIVGFTSISDRIPSGHVVHLLEQIFVTLDAVCEKHDVIKIKTIGDSYMAVAFGEVKSEESRVKSEESRVKSEHIHNAAACSLEMIASLDALEITMPPALGDTSWTKEVGDIKVRIGIHCGPVTAGVIGTARMQYDVWGDTVNTASRMESTSEPNRIHVSEQFANALSDERRHEATRSDVKLENGTLNNLAFATWHLALRGLTEVKGKGSLTTYWLESTSVGS